MPPSPHPVPRRCNTYIISITKHPDDTLNRVTPIFSETKDPGYAESIEPVWGVDAEGEVYRAWGCVLTTNWVCLTFGYVPDSFADSILNTLPYRSRWWRRESAVKFMRVDNFSAWGWPKDSKSKLFGLEAMFWSIPYLGPEKVYILTHAEELGQMIVEPW